jgi:hypothetical protein
VIRLAVLFGAILLWPATAGAHLVTSGLGPLYDGISHVLVSPDDLLPAVTMGLLAGLNGAAAGRHAMILVPLAWLAAGYAALLLGAPPAPGVAAAGSFLVLGGLTALDWKLTAGPVRLLAFGVGGLHGWLNGAALADSQADGFGLVGIGAAVFVLVTLAAAFAVSMRAPWGRLAIRVAGSWMAAIGLLVVGWSLRAGA